MTVLPFDDIRDLCAALPDPDEDARVAAVSADTPPVLADLAGWIAAWRGRPAIVRPILALYAGAHDGLGDMAAVRAQMEAIAAGDAPVARAIRHQGAGLDVFDLAIDRPVHDMVAQATLSERNCAATMAFGMEALAKQPDLLALGALGAERPAAALAHALLGGSADDWAAGEDLEPVAAATRRALSEGPADPLQLLRQLGGRETAAIAGAILAARTQRVPVVLNGYVALAGAAVVRGLAADGLAHCRLGAAPADPGARRLAQALGISPMLDVGRDGGDGTGAAAALSLIGLACAIGAPAAS